VAVPPLPRIVSEYYTTYATEPDTSDYYKEVREKLLEIGANPGIKDDLVDLQEMRVVADYRNNKTIKGTDAKHFMLIAVTIIEKLDKQFPESKLQA